MSQVGPPDDQALPSLDPQQVLELSRALRCWADRHPDPHRPLISFGGERFVSADELAEAVGADPDREERYPDRRDQIRQQYLHMVRLVLLETPFDLYLASIERSGNPRNRLGRLALEARDLVLARWRMYDRRPHSDPRSR